MSIAPTSARPLLPTLYYSPMSSSSYRILITLAMKRVAFRPVICDIAANEHRTSDYLALNPQGLIPTLITPAGDSISQSYAIFQWLEQQFPTPSLMPEDPLLRCKVIAFCNIIACDIHALQGLRLRGWLEQEGVDEEVFRRIARRAIGEGLFAAEQWVAARPGAYCFGDTVTAADIWLIPQLRNARRFDVDLSPYQNLTRVERRCMEYCQFKA